MKIKEINTVYGEFYATGYFYDQITDDGNWFLLRKNNETIKKVNKRYVREVLFENNYEQMKKMDKVLDNLEDK